jgi:hypothetical protein
MPYPFEVAKLEEILHFYRDRGFAMVNHKTCGGQLGNNQLCLKGWQQTANENPVLSFATKPSSGHSPAQM